MKRWLIVVLTLSIALAIALFWWLAAETGSVCESAERVAGRAEPHAPVVTERAPARVSGRVVRDGVGVSKARVSFRGAIALVAWSGEDGRFTIDDAPLGPFVLSASFEALASLTMGPFQLVAGGAVDDIVLALTPAVQVEGVVVDLVRRAPIPGATVVSAEQVAKSDEQGRFKLAGAGGATWLEVSAPRFLSRMEWVSLELAKTGGRLELVLTPASRLEGVVSELGAPVGGATVWAEVVEGSGRGDRTSTVFSATDGGFSVEATAGLLRLTGITPRGSRLSGPTLRLAVGETRSGLVLEVGENSNISGVVSRDGAPLAGAQLSAIGAANEDVAAVASSGPTGQFQFPALANGRYVVQVRHGAFTAIAGPFEQTGDGRTWAVVLAAGHALRGRAEPASAGVRVRWRSGTWSGPSADTVTDAQGRFEFEGLPDEPVSIDAEGPSGAATTRARPGDDVVLRLAKGQVIVHLSDDLGGPLTDGVLMSRSLDTGAVRRQLVLAPDGVTRLDLPAGSWELMLEVAGRGRSEAARVEVRGVAMQVRLMLERSIVVTGQVTDASNGMPIAGAHIEAHSGTNGNAFRVAVTTDARGEFTLPPTPVRATIVARHEAYIQAWRTAGESAQWKVALNAAKQPGQAPPQQFEGVGMVLDGNSGRVVVVDVNDGGPAERAGVQKGDVILAVDEVATAGVPLDQVIARIRGPAGTPVRLRFERAGQQFELTIRRRLLTL